MKDNNKINLLFIVNSLCIGGAEKHVVSLLNQLDQRKFGLHLAVLKENYALLPQLTEMSEENIILCNVSSKVDLGAARKIASVIDKNDIDIVVNTNQYPMIYNFLAKILSKRNVHSINVFHSTELLGVKSKLKMFVYKPLFRRLDKLIYVCEAQKEFWKHKGLGAKSDRVIHNGVDSNIFRDDYDREDIINIRTDYGFAKEDVVIGLCAALRPEKAHRDLIEAVSRLKRKGYPVKCLLIGDGPEREAITRYIDDYRLNQDVIITGFMDDVRPLISACDFMTLVSHSETFSISALESMSLRKCLVMSDVGGAKEQIRDGSTGYLYQKGSVDGLENAIEKLIDKSRAQKLGENAFSFVNENFTMKAMIDKYEDCFSKVAKGLK